MKKITVRGVEIGSGIPKICVPLAGDSPAAMIREAEKAAEMPCDLLEIRADHMLPSMYLDIDVDAKLIGDVRDITGKPVIYTLRTLDEGGWAHLERREYLDHIRNISERTDVDIVDCEAFAGDMYYEPDRMEIMTDMAHANGKLMIMSSHDFDYTPDMEEIVRKYCAMDNMRGDILKIAVMPRKEEDVLALLEAARVFSSDYSETDIIAISMGELGSTTRVCGGEFGSVITFASGVRSTAPGQMQADRLKQALDEYYR